MKIEFIDGPQDGRALEFQIYPPPYYIFANLKNMIHAGMKDSDKLDPPKKVVEAKYVFNNFNMKYYFDGYAK